MKQSKRASRVVTPLVTLIVTHDVTNDNRFRLILTAATYKLNQSMKGTFMTTHRLPDTQNQAITFAAQPAPFTFEPVTSAVLVVDMQNDFGAQGGMLE